MESRQERARAALERVRLGQVEAAKPAARPVRQARTITNTEYAVVRKDPTQHFLPRNRSYKTSYF